MLRESRSRQDVSKVSGGVPWEKRIPLTARNTSSLVIDRLCDRAKQDNIAVACLYYDFQAQEEQTITNMIGVILKQLVGMGDIPGNVREAFHEGKKQIGGRRPRLEDLMRMLKAVVASLPQVFICIDALDECRPKNLPELLESLRDIFQECSGMRIFLTGRPHVREAIRRYFAKAVVIPISPNPDDIRNYLDMRLDRDDEPEAMSHDLRADIKRTLLEKMSDMCVGESDFPPINDAYLLTIMCRFLLVSLNIDAILGEMTIRQRRKKLEEMARGNGLSDAYTETLTRLKAQKGNRPILGLKVLMWVSCSQRPLRSRELCYALGVEMGSTELDLENVPALKTLLSSCLGLVTVEASSSTIRLVHFTLQEYLSNDPILFDNPHSTIAEVCLTHLNFGSVRSVSPTLHKAPPTMPFLEYASLYWGEHARRGMTENVKRLSLSLLLEGFDQHISAQLLFSRYHYERGWGSDFNGEEGRTGLAGLHAVASLGLVEVVAALLEMKGWDINAAGWMGGTLLTWAAERGQETVVKMLLERKDVNPDQPDTHNNRTALGWAAALGHLRVAKLLLERKDVNPDHIDTGGGRTPLSMAAQNGREEIVKFLLERKDVNPNYADGFSRTPLAWAALRGHEGVVKMLLEIKNIRTDTLDYTHQTPLSLARSHGHPGIAELLLEWGNVKSDVADPVAGSPRPRLKRALEWVTAWGARWRGGGYART